VIKRKRENVHKQERKQKRDFNTWRARLRGEFFGASYPPGYGANGFQNLYRLTRISSWRVSFLDTKNAKYSGDNIDPAGISRSQADYHFLLYDDTVYEMKTS